MDIKIYYEKRLELLVGNIILHVSDIVKMLGQSLAEFTEPVGFSISAVSRIRKKVKVSPKSALENMSYALCMFTALDSIYLFKDIDTNVREQIEEMLLKNLCEEVTLYSDTEGRPITSSGYEFQSWFRMDYKTGRGFAYQLQFFLHEISKMKEGNELKLIEVDLLQKLQNAKVAFTIMGLKIFESKFQDIKNSLEKIYMKDFSKEGIYVSRVINDEIYYDNISKELYSYVKVCTSKLSFFKEDEYVPYYVRDFAEIVEYCLQDDSYLLLFVQDEDNMLKCLSMLNKNYKDKIIFAYNKYFDSVGHFKIVFDYKNNIFIMNFDDSISKYENLLGGWKHFNEM